MARPFAAPPGIPAERKAALDERSDAFLVLAQTESGVSCFLMPRFTPDGERNAFHINRLKEENMRMKKVA